MIYKILVRPRAEKHFARLPKKSQQRVLSILKKLEDNPFQHHLDIKKLVGTKRSYRLRIGELRILYEMETKIKQIFITDIDFRRTTTY